jgi:pyruvate kinase
MATVALRAEASLSEYGYLQKIKPNPSNVVTEAVSQATVTMTAHLKAAAIISLTESGFTSRQISKYRPGCPILAITSSAVVARKLAINWGVIPVLYEGEPTDNARIAFAIARARELLNVGAGDILVVTAGQHQKAGGTDLIRVITLES